MMIISLCTYKLQDCGLNEPSTSVVASCVPFELPPNPCNLLGIGAESLEAVLVGEVGFRVTALHMNIDSNMFNMCWKSHWRVALGRGLHACVMTRQIRGLWLPISQC
jgi:hypothetical protein